MPKKIAFLHTVPGMIGVFNSFLEAYKEVMTVSHLVDESLLEDAMSIGYVDTALSLKIETQIKGLINEGADLVVCTCSSIGAVAEKVNEESSVEVQRIDRAMADEAVRIGKKILLAATLSSTLEPTRDLLFSSAKNLAKAIEVDEIVISKAWERLQEGDREGYISGIVRHFKNTRIDADIVVLAQGSMSDAKEFLKDSNVPFLSSLELGFQRIIDGL